MELSVRHVDAPQRLLTLGYSWPLIVALLALAGVLLAAPAQKTLADPDTYWHLATGRWILEHAAVPSRDPFSHSMPGVQWSAHEWLSEVLMVGVHRFFGWSGSVVLAAASLAGTLAGLTRFLLKRMEPVHALLFVGLAAALCLPHLLARPHVLAWPLMTLWVGTLIDAAESSRRPPWWLLAVMLVWANAHGSFTLGLAFVAALAADAVVASAPGTRLAVARCWALFVALSLGVSMLTPSGWGGLVYTFHVMSLSASLSMIGEWASPDFHQRQPLEVWLLLMMGLALSGRVRLPVLRLLLVLGLVHLALKHQRNVAILGLLAPLLMAAPMARHWYATTAAGGDAETLDRWFRALAAPARPLTMGLSLLLVLPLLMVVVNMREPSPAANITPSAALAAARAAGVDGPVLNAYNFGGYLIDQGIKVALDGRADMYGDAFMKRNVEALGLKDGEKLPSMLADYRIGWTMLEPGTPAIALLDMMPGWRRVHADTIAVVHRRVAAGTKP